MSEPSLEMENNPDLSAILEQLQALSQRVAYLEEKLKLVSDIDRYSKLQELLIIGKFKEADAETTNVILETANKTREALTPNDMANIPCNTLQVIDRLWRDYSQNRFGFSIQLQIYQEVGGSIDTLRTQDPLVIEKYGDRVGWRKEKQWQANNYDNWDFSLSAPVGCFPAAWWKSPYGLKMVTFCFMRLLNCNLNEK